jgi:hypothetical protein
MQIYIIEIILIIVTFLLALYELLGVWRANKIGLTNNISRIISHAVIVVFIIGGVIQSLYWQEQILNIQTTLLGNVPMNVPINIPLINLPLFFLAGLTAIISGVETLEVYRAKRQGLTNNISRIATHTAMFMMMAVIISMNAAVSF